MNLPAFLRVSLPPSVAALPVSPCAGARTASGHADYGIWGENLNFSISTKQGRRLPILKNCSIQIPPGQLWMLLGPNGCGKSTLLKVLAGLLKPTDGSVYVRKPKSFVFQNPDHQAGVCIFWFGQILWIFLLVCVALQSVLFKNLVLARFIFDLRFWVSMTCGLSNACARKTTALWRQIILLEGTHIEITTPDVMDLFNALHSTPKADGIPGESLSPALGSTRASNSWS